MIEEIHGKDSLTGKVIIALILIIAFGGFAYSAFSVENDAFYEVIVGETLLFQDLQTNDVEQVATKESDDDTSYEFAKSGNLIRKTKIFMTDKYLYANIFVDDDCNNPKNLVSDWDLNVNFEENRIAINTLDKTRIEYLPIRLKKENDTTFILFGRQVLAEERDGKIVVVGKILTKFNNYLSNRDMTLPKEAIALLLVAKKLL